MSRRRLGKSQRAKLKWAKAHPAESEAIARAWRKARSALQLLYDRPVNRQAAKDLSRSPQRDSN